MSKITNKDGIEIELQDTQIKTIEQFIKEADLNMDEWEILRYIANKWDVTMKINDIPVLRENWQTKLVLKKRLDITNIEEFKQAILKEFKQSSIKVPKVTSSKLSNTGNMLELNIPDLHVGKIGIEELNNTSGWSSIKAYKEFNKVIDYFISNIFIKPEKIVLVLGNDIINTDTYTPFPQTTNGTSQSEDTYWPLLFRFVKYMLVEAIYKLYKIVPNIHIVMIKGNHDYSRVFYLGEVLEALFYYNENITVDNSINDRKYFLWGTSLLGFTHGNHKNEGLKRLSYLMQEEVPSLWAKSKIREWHLGDIHHNKRVQIQPEEDLQGIHIRFFRTLMVGDPWEHMKGYISRKGADMLVWNKTKGKVLEIAYNKI